MRYRILVTGASVAGSALAWWLGHLGHDVALLEKADAFRDGGQNIDVRGVGRDVLRRMGLDEPALERGTGETGTAWIDREGRVAVALPTDENGSDGPTAEMEILRGDLARLLFEAARDRADVRLGDSIAGIQDHGDRAAVTFASGGTEVFDAVIVAEGVGSATRELVFPGENDPRWMGLTLAYFTIPRVSGDDRMWRWFHAPGGRSVSLRPDRRGTTRAMLSARRIPEGAQHWGVERQKAFLRQYFAGAGWQTERVLAGLDGTDDFYFDVLRQVRMPRWSRGRVALSGDAAWCATPLAGIGATLAITGAFVLAHEVSRTKDIGAAFAAYERAMRPMVEQAQGIPTFVPKLANPQTRLGIRLLHGALRIASSPVSRRVAGRLFARPPKAPDLSAYDNPVA